MIDISNRFRSPKTPYYQDGMRIGLYGGSFNPPHEGHLLVSERALKYAELDRIWWMVTPGNPLKDNIHLTSLEKRMAACKQLIHNPQMIVTDFEKDLNSHYTVDTLSYLKKKAPHVQFIWIMGADSLMSFHKWKGWKEIARLMPILIIDRPGYTLKATQSPAGFYLKPYRVSVGELLEYQYMSLPRWAFLYGPRSHLSSTLLRQRGKVL